MNELPEYYLDLIDPHVRKTYAIRSFLLALPAFAVQWGLFELALRAI